MVVDRQRRDQYGLDIRNPDRQIRVRGFAFGLPRLLVQLPLFSLGLCLSSFSSFHGGDRFSTRSLLLPHQLSICALAFSRRSGELSLHLRKSS